ncbi:MAG: tryptophan synthase subunit beta [Coxiella sp. (in: Bacteria)]|nr:MAG: tryptophan synthase subunit beta [Coxiella sp. (in: g-proteobacteria)]
MNKLKLHPLLVATNGRFGEFGGLYVPEGLVTPLKELRVEYDKLVSDAKFHTDFIALLQSYAGRPTPITEVSNFSKAINGPRIILKREDLLHSGAHKLNNALGQCLLAKRMGKQRIIAETGAGQHGVATATACAKLNLDCVVYMGTVDMARQMPNVERMRLLGAEVISVDSGSKTLKDAVNEALRDWAATFDDSHYCLGSALGPDPFPEMVAFFQSIIGAEAREQCLTQFDRLPSRVIACVGGGSNAIGIFSAFLDDEVKLIGVEAGGTGDQLGEHAARFRTDKKGVLHGTYSYLLQTEQGQIAETHSISAGLDYPSVGPQHAALHAMGRATYDAATDDEAIDAFKLLTRTEGIIPALESSHALAYVCTHSNEFSKDELILVNLSGRGDKDLPSLFERGLV